MILFLNIVIWKLNETNNENICCFFKFGQTKLIKNFLYNIFPFKLPLILIIKNP